MKQKLSEQELLAYLGGIIDGEGSIGIHYDCTHGNKHYYTRLRVGSVTPCITDFLVQAFGGKVSLEKREQENHRDVYVWWIFGKEAEALLERVYPYLLIKMEQARLIMFFKNAEYGEDLSYYHKKLKELNIRGRPLK